MPRVAYVTRWPTEVIELVSSFAPQDYEIIGLQESASEKERVAAVKDADFIILHELPLSEHVLQSASKLRLLQLLGAGFDHVDLPLMAELGVPVANVSGANRQGVAEMTIALILCVYRRIANVDARMRNGQWQGLVTGFNTFELNKKTVGIVGFGKIGQTVGQCLRGFNTTTLYHDLLGYPDTEKVCAAKRVSFDELLEESDVVTIHVPLVEENRGLIGEGELSRMKPTAILVNTSRGAVVDERSLTTFLKQGRIRGAGLDVFDEEPIQCGNPLLDLDNVVLSPHAAGGTYESWPRRAGLAFENLQRVMQGKAPLSLIQE